MADDQEDLQRMLAELRGDYARVLPSRISGIESLWREIAGGKDRHEELLRAVHSIAGGAETFGMPEVGRAAIALEEALRSKQDSAGIAAGLQRLAEASRAALANR